MAKQKLSLQQLSEQDYEFRCSKTKMRSDYVIKNKFTDDTANSLTKSIIAKLQLDGWQAERISTTGRYIDDTKIVTDVMGYKKKIGSGKYIPGSGTKGSADISATIKGLSVKIEVKMKDVQSEFQKVYQENIERAGGIYFIARDYDEFMMFYTNIVNPI
jgi:Holliday junction resolvase